MPRIKQWLWLITRFCVLGPLAMVIMLGQWAEDAFNYLDNVMQEDKDGD